MNLFRRHIGRRVAGVGVGVALLVLGLEAPALAVPAVTSFTPTSGPSQCVVVVTGTGFRDFPQADQDLIFVGPATGTPDPDDVSVPDALWTRISGTEIWTEVPAALALGTSYTLKVTDPTGGTASTTTFFRTSGAGACAPTIASFTPTCGSAGDVVTITGTNLIGPGLVGGEVRFSPYPAAAAAVVQPDVDTPTTLKRIVPTGAADGPIRVNTFATAAGGQVFSSTNFLVPPPDCVTAVPFARSITLKLAKHLVAKGKVSAAEVTPPAPAECTAGVPVKIQRKVSGAWKTVGKTTTSDTGTYKKKIKDKPGKYRSRAVKLTLESGEVCGKATSPVRKHSH